MHILFDKIQLQQIIKDIYLLTGIEVDILDAEGGWLHVGKGMPTFCRLINASPVGHTRCKDCDKKAVAHCAAGGKSSFYRCHAGICETIIPVYGGSEPMAYLMFGHLLDESSIESQWENSLKNLGWYEWDMSELRGAFFELRQYSREQISAFTHLMEALSVHIRHAGMIRSAEQGDLYRLESYIEMHYTENLTLAGVAEELKIGRTKLCGLAKKLSGGKTFVKLVTEKRIENAKILLRDSAAPVSAVAGAVGISDYNYFTKVFKASTGMTPKDYRKKNRT